MDVGFLVVAARREVLLWLLLEGRKISALLLLVIEGFGKVLQLRVSKLPLICRLTRVPSSSL